MGNTERIYKIDHILAERTCVPRKTLEAYLGVSWATLKRDLAYMKDRLNAPVVFDRELGGYRFDRNEKRAGPKYELPGLWFSAEEIHALLTMQHLLSRLDRGGLLGPHVKPMLARLTGLLGTAEDTAEEVRRRVKVAALGAREFHLHQFQAVGSALLRRKRLAIRYHARGTDETTERAVSPQRLIHYRDNWYLDAWCHLRDGLRSFSVDAIEMAEILDKRAKDVADSRLDEVLGSGYGIFSGDRIAWATLQFTPARALGRHRALALEAGGQIPQGRQLRTEAALRRRPRTRHGRLEVRRRLQSGRAESAARQGGGRTRASRGAVPEIAVRPSAPATRL